MRFRDSARERAGQIADDLRAEVTTGQATLLGRLTLGFKIDIVERAEELLTPEAELPELMAKREQMGEY